MKEEKYLFYNLLYWIVWLVFIFGLVVVLDSANPIWLLIVTYGCKPTIVSKKE